MLLEQIDEAVLQATARVALDQIKAETSQFPGRRLALDGNVGDRGGVQSSRELLFDDRSGADRHFVDDQLARRDAERHLLADLEADERALTCVDGAQAHLAGRRIGMELLNGAGEQVQQVLDRDRVGCSRCTRWRREPRVRAARHRSAAAAQTCRSGVRTVMAGTDWRCHGFGFSLSDR
jgi:hypothetical protein